SGDTGARVETAISIWKAGYAPVLIFSGASSDPQSASSAELMKRTALAAGVPASSIVVEGSSATTEENATNVAQIMRAQGLHTAILVTSPYHQRRAALLFTREFDAAGLVFRNHPADDPDRDLQPERALRARAGNCRRPGVPLPRARRAREERHLDREPAGLRPRAPAHAVARRARPPRRARARPQEARHHRYGGRARVLGQSRSPRNSGLRGARRAALPRP